MQTIIDFLSKPWVGALLGIAGIVAAIYFYFRSRGVSQLSFQHDGVSLLGASNAAFPEEVEIKFSGEMVNKISAERFVLWNSGNTTIGGSQIVSSDPLCVRLSGDGKLLKTNLIKVSREVNAINVNKKNDNIAEISFDYLDPNDGILFEIIHSGNRSELELIGTLRGLPQGLKDLGRADWYRNRNLSKSSLKIIYSVTMMWTMTVFAFLFLLFGLYRPVIAKKYPKYFQQKIDDNSKPEWAAVVLGSIYTALPLFLIWVKRKRYPTPLDSDDNQSIPQKS